MKISFNRIFFIHLKPYSQLYFVVKIIKTFLVCIDYNDSHHYGPRLKRPLLKTTVLFNTKEKEVLYFITLYNSGF